jgi:CelD/BcsL family acetyltransferase involved in cellulose biosynthesis
MGSRTGFWRTANMTYRLIEIASIDQLRAAAASWDDLWRRSDATLPTLRAELVAQWLEHFAPQNDFRALVVENQGQAVAALPLFGRKLAGLVPAVGMPSNEWSSCGDLLLDPTADADAAVDLLVAALRRLPWPLAWFDEAPLETRRWQSLQQAFARAAVATDRRVHYRVGYVEIGPDWEAYRQTWSGKHRQKMAWATRQTQQIGDLEFVLRSRLAPESVGQWLRRGLEIEDRSWKGQAGSSVLRTPGMFRFFLRQAEQLARWDALELGFLRCGEHEVAFVYGMNAKGVFHSCKIGYDPQYARLSPGQLLRYCLLEQLHAGTQCRQLDFQGPMTDAHRVWKPATYAVGRLSAAPGPLLGRLLLRTYQRVRPCRNDADCSDQPMACEHPMALYR